MSRRIDHDAPTRDNLPALQAQLADLDDQLADTRRLLLDTAGPLGVPQEQLERLRGINDLQEFYRAIGRYVDLNMLVGDSLERHERLLRQVDEMRKETRRQAIAAIHTAQLPKKPPRGRRQAVHKKGRSFYDLREDEVTPRGSLDLDDMPALEAAVEEFPVEEVPVFVPPEEDREISRFREEDDVYEDEPEASAQPLKGINRLRATAERLAARGKVVIRYTLPGEEPVEHDEERLAFEDNDIDFRIRELHTSINRHDTYSLEELISYHKGLEAMIAIFQQSRPDAKTNIMIRNITRYLKLIKEVFEAACGFDETSQLKGQTIESLAAIFRECGIDLPAFQRLFAEHKVTQKECHFGVDRNEESEGEGEEDTDVAAMEKLAGSRRRTDSADKDPQTFHVARHMAQISVPLKVIEHAISQHERNRGKNYELRKLYMQALEQLSLELDKRNLRQAPAILHSGQLDIKGFDRAVRREEFPERLWRQQREVPEAVRRAFKQGIRRMYFSTPAGTGKTLIIITLTQLLNPDGNTLIVTPHGLLCSQFAEDFREEVGRRDIGLIAGTQGIFDQPVTIGTAVAVKKYAQEGLFPGDKFGLIFLDEAHRISAAQREDILSAFPNTPVICSTATGRNVDGRNLSDDFRCVYEIPLQDGMAAGIVNPVRLHRVSVPQSDTADDKQRAIGDLGPRTRAILEAYRKYCITDDGKRQQAIVTMDSIERAEVLRKIFNENADIRTNTIHSRVGKESEIGLDIAFRHGQFPVLVLVDLLTEGWDYPALQYGILGDPLYDEWRVEQRLGRLIRKSPGKGESVLIEMLGGCLDAVRYGQRRVIDAPETTPLDSLFGLRKRGFKNGDLLVEPKSGFWPKNPFKV